MQHRGLSASILSACSSRPPSHTDSPRWNHNSSQLAPLLAEQAAARMPSLDCNLTLLECDEMEFEGWSAVSVHLPLLQGEVLLAACLVGLTALLYTWGRLFGSNARAGPKHVHQAEPTSPPAPVSPSGPGRPAWPGPAYVGLPANPPAGTAPAPAGQHPRPSLSPGPSSDCGQHPLLLSPSAALARGACTSSLLKPPSALLRRLSELGQKLGLPQRVTPWLMGPSRAKAGKAGEGLSAHLSPGTRYGLGLGEAESADEEEDDLTSQQLRALEKTPEFQRYLQGKGLTKRDVVTVGSRLRLYRRLRELDPAGFRMLCRADTLCGFETQDPPRWAHVLEYIFTLAANLGAALMAHFAWAHGGGPALLRAACAAAAWWLTGAAWAQGRSRGGVVLGMWYEDLAWGRGVPAWRAAAANLFELVYVCGTVGLGAVVSIALRCGSGSARRQSSVGERCAGVRQVWEVAVPSEELAA